MSELHDAPLKWVDFSRRVYAVIAALVVVSAGVSGLINTYQARGLLEDSLSVEGKAIADAVARAVFVPLTLEDRPTIERLVESYRGVRGAAALRVLDARGKVVQAAVFERPKDILTATAVVRPRAEPGEPAGEAIGTVEVDLSKDALRALARRIAWFNMALAAGLSALVSLIGWLLVRTLVARMRELVGEARLVAQVRLANAELESFSYSVSHDLRAPLRGVAGFATILQRRLGPTLDKDNKENLERVVAGAKRMGEIIDDLLQLSRVSRRELERQNVDLSAMARSILEELRRREPKRKVTAVVADGLRVRGDATLLRTALENLLGNAWKYSSKKAEARIEVGQTARDGERAYFVRDDGAGFDMAHAGGLFKPFQRLHKESEFEGTGVGLATVERVVRRHGGRIWADAKAGEGATFYFTLESKGGHAA